MPAATEEEIMALIREHHPSSPASLKRVLRKRKIELSEAEFLRLVGQLQSEGQLSVHHPEGVSSFIRFLKDYNRVWWAYAILLVASAEAILVVYDVTDQVLSVLRFLFSLALLGFVPGYSTIRAAFPDCQLSTLEQVILSIFLSVLVSISLGTILGAELLFSAEANVFLLSSYTFASTLTGVYRSFAFHEEQVCNCSAQPRRVDLSSQMSRQLNLLAIPGRRNTRGGRANPSLQ